MLAVAARKGNTFAIDSLIAATALHYNLSVVTNNEKHFKPAGVATTNPWI